MRKSKILAKLRDGKLARICSMGHFLPYYICYAAQLGYDGIWLDLEHRAWGEREVQSLLMYFRQYDIDCMLRPAARSRTRLYRYLEEGVSGFLVPFVDNEEMARHLVSAVKFPPLGNRGVDGYNVETDFGLRQCAAGSTYPADANRENFIIAQIETPQALANAQRIAAVEGIDGIFVGPRDLQLRLSVQEGPAMMPFEEAVEQVAAVARENGKAWGITVSSTAELKRYHKMGAQMLPWGSDFALAQVLTTCSNELDAIQPMSHEDNHATSSQ